VIADVNGAYDNYEAAATISDTAGNLLFYTDAETVWNRNHQVMQNGTSIGGCWSSTQGALIVPQPGNDSLYYIFTTDCAENNLAGGLRYSIVNINLDNGLGAVIQKGILLHTPVAEKIAGIYHANKTDVWVVTHEWNNSNFLAYLITNSGIDTVPVISSIGSVHSGFTQNGNSNGYMKFSPNGKKIVSIKYESSILELFDFNDSTGIISNSLMLNSGGNMLVYGASFSPDNSKLYVSYPFDSQVTIGGKLYQFNILAGSSSDIIASKTLIYYSNGISKYHFLGIQIGLNNKIYLAETFFQTNDGGFLGVINEPNKIGAICNFAQLGIPLLGKRSRGGLPNFIESYFNCDTCTVDSSAVGIIEPTYLSSAISIFPNPLNGVLHIECPYEILSWQITDVHGIIVNKCTLHPPQKNVQISNLSLPHGIYAISIKTKSATITKKLMQLKD
jgi:hypothetical protein